MKLVLLTVNLLSILDCASLQNPDFVFPDDNEPDGIPKWVLNPSQRFPSQFGFPHLNNFPSQRKFPPQNNFPSQNNFPPENDFPPQNNFPPQFPEKFINEPKLPIVPIADIATITTTPSPSFHICMQSCPVTSEYNPVCGSNRALYYNLSKLRCAQSCGADAQIVRRGSCRGLFPMAKG